MEYLNTGHREQRLHPISNHAFASASEPKRAAFDGTKVETTGNFSTNKAGRESCRVLAKVSGEADTECSTELLERELSALPMS